MISKGILCYAQAIIPAIALATPAFAQTADGAGQSSAPISSGDGLQDIIVTARRVEENQQRVPISVTTLNAEALAKRTVTNVSDIQFGVANLQIKPNTNYPSQPDFVMRGQRQVLFTDENVVTYLNGVAMGSRGLTLYDLQSVQALKGPQGTLFGKNSLGGAMVFTTTKPTYDFGGSLSVDVGNYNLRRVTAVANIPLATDMAALRLAGQIERRDGVYRNLYPGMSDLGDRHNQSVRATLLLQPNDRIESLFVADYLSRQEILQPSIMEAALVPQAGATGFQIGLLTTQLVQQQSQFGGSEAVQIGNLLERRGNPYVTRSLTGIDEKLPGPLNLPAVNGIGTRVKTYGFANNTTLELNDNLSLKNIIAYRYDAALDQSDASASSGKIVDIAPFFAALQGAPVGTPGIPPLMAQFTDNGVQFYNKSRQFSNEFQIIGKANNLNFISGLYYSDVDGTYSANSAFVVGPATLYTDEAFNPYLLRHAEAKTKTRSFAAFAQATYDFAGVGLNGVRMTAGLRYTVDKRDYSGTNFYTNNTSTLQAYGSNAPQSCNEVNGTFGGVTGINNGSRCEIFGSRTYRGLTWTASLEYQVNPSTLLYLANRRGFKAGTSNPTTRNLQFAFFGPERLTDFELGTKSQGRIGSMPFRLNLAGFIGKYKNIQTQDILQFCVEPLSCNGNAVYTDLIIFNVGQATIKGFEAEATLKPFPFLTLDGSYTYQIAKYGAGSVVPQPVNPAQPVSALNPIDYGAGVNLSGVEFAGVPRHTVNASLTYEARWVPETFAKPTLSVNYSYRGSTKGLAVQGTYKTPSFSVWGARLNLDNLLESPVSISFWGKNIFNKAYRLSCLDNLNSIGYASCYWDEPRTYGVSASAKF